jgi:transcriptional regulator with XRE-family HTH domain
MGRPISPLKRKSDTTEEALGAVITELRVKRKWSYQDVAHKVGCNDAHMNEIEHGKQNPTLKTLQAIADVHHIKLSKLFALAERKYERSQAKKRAVKPKTKTF